MSTLRLVLGDQLSHSISSLSDCDKRHDLILICEVMEEATYVKHHKKKIAFLFSAMRHFAEELRQHGYSVEYVKLDDNDNTGSLQGEFERCVRRFRPNKAVVTFPGEYRVLKNIQAWRTNVDIELEIREDQRFLCSSADFASWAGGRKQLRLEYFYREMRKRHKILMNGGQPEGGKWNYDSDNRKSAPETLRIPSPYRARIDAVTAEVLALVNKRFNNHFGVLDNFHFAVTHAQARYALTRFIEERLKCFGDYQDAMIEGEAWMYHSHLGLYLNCGLLEPLECIVAAETAYREGNVPLNAAEGFIRQILGWREFIRGIYWLKMPAYARQNHLNARRKLPHFYWTAETPMNCLRQCISETRENAYAHHIQRLMVLGNFALLAGIDPVAVNNWYLLVYADAYEWVELPNVSGMVLYADGGLLASKPYAASGNYINKMSNYCKSCDFKVNLKNGNDACPFNYLYWHFLAANREKLEKNHRLSLLYKSYDRMSSEKKAAISEDSRRFLASLP